LVIRVVRHPVVVHLAVLLGFLGAGIAVTWPHATYLAGKLPNTRDAGSYVWGFWWMAHSVLNFQDPWVTTYIAAPVGTQLGLHALMPLAGVVMLPVTLMFGPSASYTLLSIMLPGLMAYAMYRVARLWLPSQVGPIAAGAFFGFSSMLDYQTWVHLNLAAGALFLPITLEAAIRLRRKPRPVPAVVLGVVLGASMLVDQQSAIMCLILVVAALLPWLLPYLAKPKTAPASEAAEEPATPPETRRQTPIQRARQALTSLLRRPRSKKTPPLVKAEAQSSEDDLADDDTEPIPVQKYQIVPTAPPWKRLRSGLVRLPARAGRGAMSLVLRLRIHWVRWLVAALAAAVAFTVALPQLIAVKHVWLAASVPANISAGSYVLGIRLPDMFLPSPRVTMFDLTIPHAENPGTFGAVAELLALTGLVLAWRRRNAWLLAVFFVGVAALSVGSDILLKSGAVTPMPEMYNGVPVSKVLPFTWFVQIPGLSGFREPSRLAELGLVPIALLAGYAVNWLRYRARVLVIPVLALGILEAGLATPPGASTMAASYPALDRPIAADHSGSIVLDIPFGLRGGTGVTGQAFVPQAQVLATADGHPLAEGLLSRVPNTTVEAIDAEPFYHDLMSTQSGHYQFSQAELLAAAKNAADMHIGWILLWERNKNMRAFLVATGFNYAYRADGASVWRPDGYANGIMTSP